MITIHNFPRGARGVRVAWLCEEMGLPYNIEKVTFPTDAAYRALNPLGSVPFLVDGDVRINESVAMLIHLAQHHGPTPLLPAPSDPAHGRAIQMTVFTEATLGAGLNVLMAAKFAAPEADKENWSVRFQRDRVDSALAYAEGVLAEQPHFAGETFTIADIAMATALTMRRGALGAEVPAGLAAWHERVLARPAYKRALERAS